MMKTSSYSDWRRNTLANPEAAFRYIEAAYEDSPEMFAIAIKNVHEALEFKKVSAAGSTDKPER